MAEPSQDKLAFKKLMEKYVKIAGSIAYSVVGDFHIAADVIQEAFSKVYRNLSSLDNPGTFRSYLANTVRSSALDWVRKKTSLRRGSPIHFSELASETSELQSENDLQRTPLADIQNSENYEELLEAINALPQNYREVFILKHIENISYNDIAKILEISLNSVEARLFRARKMLRERLGLQEQ
jgi:RNA polymerase sigma-70 factor (ECF subfamily)